MISTPFLYKSASLTRLPQSIDIFSSIRRRESYRELKRIAHDMTKTDKATFIWWLQEFRRKYWEDFEARTFDPKTLEYRRAHPRLHRAYHSLLRDIDRLFVSLPFIEIIGKNINTSNRIECVFSHLKPKVKLHR